MADQARGSGATIALVKRELPDVELAIFSGIKFQDMPLHYCAADAMLMTSDFEGSPNCIKEAIACGLGVVTTEVGDVRQVLEGLTNCHVVDRQDPELLAARLTEVLRDGRGCPDGPERVRQRYSPQATTTRYFAFYREAMARKAAR